MLLMMKQTNHSVLAPRGWQFPMGHGTYLATIYIQRQFWQKQKIQAETSSKQQNQSLGLK